MASPPPEVQAAFDAALAEWLAAGRPTARPAPGKGPGPTIEGLLDLFWPHVMRHYVGLDGKPTEERGHFALSLRPLRHLYANLPAAEFTPLKLKAVRALMVDGYQHPKYGPQSRLARKTVNQRIGRIKAMFAWAVGEELLGGEVLGALKAVKGLAAGRSEARETEKVGPADPAAVEAALLHLGPHAAGLVRFLRYTGARCGEACRLTPRQINGAGDVWLAAPPLHKTAYRGKTRVIAIGPKGQEVLREFLRIRCSLCGEEGRPHVIGSRDGCICGPCADRMDEEGICGPWQRVECHALDAPLFSPLAQRDEVNAAKRARRKTPVQPSQQNRRKAGAAREPGEAFVVSSVGHAVAKACKKAKVAHWHPHQLRHRHATLAREAMGLDGAQAALGHSSASMTDHYSRLGEQKAAEVARRIG
jgi:integrase